MTNTNENDELPLGYSPVKGVPDALSTQGEAFPRPTLPNWGDLPDGLIEAMQDAHNDAAFMYGDEGGGYEPHLMLAYLLGSDAYKRYTRVPTPKNYFLHVERNRRLYAEATTNQAKQRFLLSWKYWVSEARGDFRPSERAFATKVLNRLYRIYVNEDRLERGLTPVLQSRKVES